MKVFLNGEGKFLKWNHNKTMPGGVWTYCWVDSIQNASVAHSAPKNVRWDKQDNPAKQIVISIPVEIKRKVVVIKEEN